MKYRGTIIEESLLDNRILNEFHITHVRITDAERAEDRWHLYTVEATRDQIDRLSLSLKPSGYYAHFWNGDNVIVVFPGKKFEIAHSKKETWEDAIAYGLTIGIPGEQLDFKLNE